MNADLVQRLAARVSTLMGVVLLAACSHPLEIVGQGDIVSASGTRNCSLADFRAATDNCAKNMVVEDYQETYVAKPADGWEFDQWLNYCVGSGPECDFNVPASEVVKHWGKSAPPLVAVFRELVKVEYPYDLPDPLVSENGTVIVNPSQWYSQRRPETLDLFAEHIYGRTPTGSLSIRDYDVELDRNALGGIATRKQLRRELKNSRGAVTLDILIYLPNRGSGPHPVFLGLNYNGNHTVNSDPNIRLPRTWVEETSGSNNRASPLDRGNREQRWKVEELIARGYGLATVYYGDIDPDYDDGFQNGVHPLFFSAGESEPAANEWGSIGAWAWGLNQAMDYLAIDPEVNQSQVAVIGFSRLGKAALWAAAQDQRFAMAISNNSGTLGASLSRREGIAQGKEPLSQIISNYGHWFAANMAQYANNPGLLPVDQHQLIALIAPRPVYIASASNDLWADPVGEFEGGKYSSAVYQLLGKEGLAASQVPTSSESVKSVVGYHLRPGNHELTFYDWQRFMDFADIHVARK